MSQNPVRSLIRNLRGRLVSASEDERREIDEAIRALEELVLMKRTEDERERFSDCRS